MKSKKARLSYIVVIGHFEVTTSLTSIKAWDSETSRSLDNMWVGSNKLGRLDFN